MLPPPLQRILAYDRIFLEHVPLFIDQKDMGEEVRFFILRVVDLESLVFSALWSSPLRSTENFVSLSELLFLLYPIAQVLFPPHISVIY